MMQSYNIFAINPNFLLLFHIIFISMIVSRLVANAQYHGCQLNFPNTVRRYKKV